MQQDAVGFDRNKRNDPMRWHRRKIGRMMNPHPDRKSRACGSTKLSAPDRRGLLGSMMHVVTEIQGQYMVPICNFCALSLETCLLPLGIGRLQVL
jgi:hypothetical protein